MNKHTPGPWKSHVDNQSEYTHTVTAHARPGTSPIIGAGFQEGNKNLAGYIADDLNERLKLRNDSHDEADARLIAAAPELLEACHCALADLEGIMPELDCDGDRSHPGWQTIDELTAAIAKATTPEQ